MLSIFKKEFYSFLSSLVAYLVIGVFLGVVGFFVWIYPETSVLEFGYAELNVMFDVIPSVFLFLIPAITMRTFSEEKKQGTLELLFTKPLNEWEIILGKYLACFALIMIALLPTMVYYFSIQSLGNPTGNLDKGAFWGSFLGMALLGGVFAAIGVFISTLTDNQLVAFIISVLVCAVFYLGFGALSTLVGDGTLSESLAQLGLEYHHHNLSKGLMDSRNLLYYFSIILLMLLAGHVKLISRNW
ncbi:MAG: gliding motility-associated ABC transporter permease subunit GldF [Cytophagales bacterium]